MNINNQILVLSNKEKKNQDSKVEARGHLKKDAIGELYNKKFKKVLYYC
jgi:hypothetical protein